MPLVFADNFLAGAILSLVMPAGLLTAIAVWYHLAVRRVPRDTPVTSTVLPPPDVLAAAEEAREPGSPAGPPAAAS